MNSGTAFRTARELVDSKRVLDVLLRRLVQRATITMGDLDTVLGVTIRKVAETVYAQAITIFMVDPEKSRISFKHVYYSPTLYQGDENKKLMFVRRAQELEALHLELNQGIVGETIRTGQAALVPDVRHDPRFFSHVDEVTGFVTESLIAVPMKIEEKVVGCIEAINKFSTGNRVIPFGQSDIHLMSEVASYSAKVIQRALNPTQAFSEEEMARYIARLAKCDYVEITDEMLDRQLLNHFGEDTLRQYKILPLERIGDSGLRAALANPMDIQAVDDFETITRFKVKERVVAQEKQIIEAIAKSFPKQLFPEDVLKIIKEEYGADRIANAAETGDIHVRTPTPIIQLANDIIQGAYEKGASDIHIEPGEKSNIVRYRVDGVCDKVLDLPKAALPALVARIKVMSELDISEHRFPQDGRIVFRKFNPRVDVDLRVSIAPMQYGEKICLRVLDKTKSALSLDKLGFSSFNLARYREAIQSPYGMILHCGPTGSGKSLTLYSALNEINSPKWNISTAEDPIEYTLPGINQMQVRKAIGLDFASVLRCFLRQDPDVILVGEIRDQETAEIAVEAALTGHLLFSTLHANDAAATMGRLIELNIRSYMISTALVCVCAQRLLRRLCPECKVPVEPKPREREFLLMAKDERPLTTIYREQGCPKCGGLGYRGRVGIHELLVMNDELRELVFQNKSNEEIKAAARRNGMRTLFEDAMEKVRSGITSMPEALGAARPD